MESTQQLFIITTLESKTMRIFVKQYNGKTYTVTVEPTDSYLDLMAKCFVELYNPNILFANYCKATKMLVRGTGYNTEATVQQNNILNDQQLQVILKSYTSSDSFDWTTLTVMCPITGKEINDPYQLNPGCGHVFERSMLVGLVECPQCHDEISEIHMNMGHPSCKGDIIIENDVWIGAHATIMSGVKISNGAIVGATATVTKDVPPYSIVVGNPAKIVKYRFSKKQIESLLEISWWNWTEDRIKTEAMNIWSNNIDEFIDRHL